MASRIEHTKRNLIWGVIYKAGLFLPTFLIRTILIRVLGEEYLGLDSLFVSILQVLSIAELGFDNAIVYCLYKPVAEKDEKSICALLGFYRKVYRIIGFTILGVGVACMPFLPKIIKGSYPQDTNIYLLYFVYLLNTFFSYVFLAYNNAVIKAHQRDDIKSKITTLVKLATYLLQAIVLIYFKNYYLYIVLLPIGTVVLNFMQAGYVRKYYPTYVCKGELNSEQKESIRKNVFGAMVLKICGVCRNSFDSIVISAFLGLVILGKYQNYYYIITMIMQLESIIRTSIVASIGNSIAVETKEKNYEDFQKYSFLMFWIIGWCTICLCCLFQPFVELWIGKEYLFDMTMVVLFCIYFYSLELGNITFVYREAAGLWWEDRYRPILESVFNLGMNILLVSIWGVHGVLLSTVVAALFLGIPWANYILFNKYFEKSVLPFCREIIKQMVICTGICIATFGICSFIHWGEATIMELVIKMTICAIFPNFIMFVIYRKDARFLYAVSIAKKIVERNSSR